MEEQGFRLQLTISIASYACICKFDLQDVSTIAIAMLLP